MTDAGRLRGLILGYRISAAIHVVAVIGISDLLTDGPRSVEDLAAAADVDADGLRRVLRALAAVGMYAEDDRGWFANNDESEGLCRDATQSVHALASFIGQREQWSTWGHLLHTVRTGENGFRDLYGADVWTYRENRPDKSDVFDMWMAANTRAVADAVVAAYDFEQVETVVDVGGGVGALLLTVLAAEPHLSGVLFEQPHVIERAQTVFATSALRHRCRLAAGNMFEQVPEGGDLYMLKSILHDWSDQDAVQILLRCRDAMSVASASGDGGRGGGSASAPRVLILERLLEGPNRGPETKFSDLNMMVMLGGKERTADEFASLCNQADLRLTRTLPTGTPWFILEAEPA